MVLRLPGLVKIKLVLTLLLPVSQLQLSHLVCLFYSLVLLSSPDPHPPSSVHLQANSAVALHQLSHSIRELGATVVERQGALTAALEGSRGRKSEALSAQVSEKQGLLEQAGLMTYTQELLKETDAPCFVQAARVTHSRRAARHHLTFCTREKMFSLVFLGM